MKNILNKLVVLLLAGFALAACAEHTEYDDTGFSAVEKLLYPSDGYALDLIEQADANLYFEWEVSKVGTPVYTVVSSMRPKRRSAVIWPTTMVRSPR